MVIHIVQAWSTGLGIRKPVQRNDVQLTMERVHVDRSWLINTKTKMYYIAAFQSLDWVAAFVCFFVF